MIWFFCFYQVVFFSVFHMDKFKPIFFLCSLH